MRSAALMLLAMAFGVIASIVFDSALSYAFGQTITAPAPQPNPLMTMLAGYAVEAIQIAAPVLLAWFSLKLNQWFGLKREAERRDALQEALENAAGKMVQSAGSAAQALMIGSARRNKALAEGLAYLEQAAPDAIAYFKLSRDSLIEKLEAKLGLKLADRPKA